MADDARSSESAGTSFRADAGSPADATAAAVSPAGSTAAKAAGPADAGRAGARKLTTSRVVFVIIAAAAPMAAMVGNTPLALLYGNGPGLPAAYAIATAALLCFCVGYAAMSRRVVNTGAFYTYVARGIGRPAGVGAAYLAVLSYTVLTIGLCGAFGYFVHIVLGTVGVTVAWEIPSAIAAAFVAFMGYRSADLSARVLGVLMVLEFAILIVFDLAVLGHKGGAALPTAALAPHNVFSGSIGIALMFAFTSFVGFESGALYGEETARPERSIPRATYIAVLSVGVFYFLTTWFTVGAIGVDRTHAVAAGLGSNLGNLLFDQAQTYAGEIVMDVMGVLLCTSVLASMLAVHNAASRYLFALGRERVLPKGLGAYHGRHTSPHVGSITITVVTVVVVGAFAVAGLDPYLTLAASMVGLSTLGVVLLQVLAAISVVAFFRRRGERDYWRTLVFPAVGAISLLVAFFLAAFYFPTLVGTHNPVIDDLPWLLGVVLAAGVLAGVWIRANRPAIYGQIALSRLRARPRTLPRPSTWSRRYCLVGAGPAGVVAARALRSEGIDFDWYERADAVGGIWNADSPGSPMYESAQFISSRQMSGFVGYPMPDTFGDYPSWREVRDYVRAFAAAEGLTDLVTFGTSVTRAEPITAAGQDPLWRVTLSTGETRDYGGVIAAPGVNWHPNMPSYPGQESFRGEARHSSSYRSAEEFRGKRVLIVGAGNSGVDIASDAARSASQAFLSVRRGYRYIPKHIGGVPTDALFAGVLPPPAGMSLPTDPAKFLDRLVGDVTRLGLPKPDHELLSSHPILNSEVLTHLAAGDLVARPDIARFTTDGVEFADGTSEQLDLVIFATGYDYLLPFLDDALLPWRHGRPDLYLNIFSRDHDGLAVLGFVEFADAAYRRFEEMAQLIVLDATARELGGEVWASWRERKVTDRPDLRGGKSYVDSRRHANYVDAMTYQVVLADLRDRYGLGDVPETGPRRLDSATDAPGAAVPA
ncbi:MAG TPA: amino acid permease [Micromonosporaceae bacterium]|nr:amino acid permease [Micromonosporaceae bacterium]